MVMHFLGHFSAALAAARAGIGNNMRLLHFAHNGLKLALTLAHAAANALVLVDLGNLAVIPVRPHGAGGAGLGAHHAAAALVHVNLGQVVHHGNGLKLAGQGATLAADATHPAVVADQVPLVRRTAQHAHGTVTG